MKKKIILILLAAMFILNACKKDSRTPYSPASSPRLEVKLNNQYMSPDKIDSAVASWEINGQVQTEKMQFAGDTLVINIQKFTQGSGKLTIQLYTKTKIKNYDLQWEKQVYITIRHTKSIILSGPSNFDEIAWFPRVIMIDQASSFTAIVGLNPADPYFLLKNIPPHWNKTELERGYYEVPGGAISVGKGYWRCTGCADASGTVENRDFFRFLPTHINNRPWRMVEIGVGLYNNTPNPGPSFYFNHY